MVKITRSSSSVGAHGPELPWAYAQTPQLRSLLREHETAQAAELNKAAGLDWRVYQTTPFIFVGDEPCVDDAGVVTALPPRGHLKLAGSHQTAGKPPKPAYYCNVRDDSNRVIGIVKKRYRILQNEHAPRLLDWLVDAGEVRYEAAGALHGGAQVWWLAKLPVIALTEAGENELQTHILFTNSHDGSTPVTVSILSVHVATQTTLAWPLAAVQRTLTIRHTDAAKKQALDAKRVLDLALLYQSVIVRTAAQMRGIRLTKAQFETFLEGLAPTPRPVIRNDRVTNQRGITMAENTKSLIAHIYAHDEQLAHLRGTLLGVVLACQIYGDHLTINRTTDASAAENRFKRLTSGASFGCSAFSHATKLLG